MLAKETHFYDKVITYIIILCNMTDSWTQSSNERGLLLESDRIVQDREHVLMGNGNS